MLVLFPKPLDGCFKLPLGVLHGYLLSISKSVCRTEFTYNSYSACVHPVGEGSIPTLGLCRCWTPYTGLVRLTAVHLSRTHRAAGRGRNMTLEAPLGKRVGKRLLWETDLVVSREWGAPWFPCEGDWLIWIILRAAGKLKPATQGWAGTWPGPVEQDCWAKGPYP